MNHLFKKSLIGIFFSFIFIIISFSILTSQAEAATVSAKADGVNPLTISGSKNVRLTADIDFASSECRLYKGADLTTPVETKTASYSAGSIVTFTDQTVTATTTYTVKCDEAITCPAPTLTSVTAGYLYWNLNGASATAVETSSSSNNSTWSGTNTSSPTSPRAMTTTTGYYYRARTVCTGSIYSPYSNSLQYLGAVNGVCSTTTSFACTAGTSSGGTYDGTTANWSCLGSGGGTTASCTKVNACTIKEVDWNGALLDWQYGNLYDSAKVLRYTCSTSNLNASSGSYNAYVEDYANTPYSNSTILDIRYYCNKKTTQGWLNQVYYGVGIDNNWNSYTMTDSGGWAARVASKTTHIRTATICN